jgi:hypothetical protein
MTPPRNPNQVPPELEDDIGKHNETEFNDDPDEEDFDDEGDDQLRDDEDD